MESLEDVLDRTRWREIWKVWRMYWIGQSGERYEKFGGCTG